MEQSFLMVNCCFQVINPLKSKIFNGIYDYDKPILEELRKKMFYV